MGSNVGTVKAFHEAFNKHDWPAIEKLVAPDCVWTDARGISYKGPQGVAQEYSKGWADAFSDGKITDAKFYDAGDTVVTEFVGRGTNDGQMGPIAATGKHVDLPYVEIYHFGSDGKVKSGSAYCDMFGLMVQMGLAEAPKM